MIVEGCHPFVPLNVLQCNGVFCFSFVTRNHVSESQRMKGQSVQWLRREHYVFMTGGLDPDSVRGTTSAGNFQRFNNSTSSFSSTSPRLFVASHRGGRVIPQQLTQMRMWKLEGGILEKSNPPTFAWRSISDTGYFRKICLVISINSYFFLFPFPVSIFFYPHAQFLEDRLRHWMCWNRIFWKAQYSHTLLLISKK